MDRELAIKYLSVKNAMIKKNSSIKIFILNCLIILITNILYPNLFVKAIGITIIILDLILVIGLFYKFTTFKKYLIFCINIILTVILLNFLTIAILLHENNFNIYVIIFTFLLQLIMIYPCIKLIKIGEKAITKQDINKSNIVSDFISIATFIGYIIGTIIYSNNENKIGLSGILIIFQLIMFVTILIAIGNINRTYLVKKYGIIDSELLK